MKKFIEELFALMNKHNIDEITALDKKFIISSKEKLFLNANVKGYKEED